MADQNGSHPLRIILLDSPRTCSHLFWKLFQSHPQLEHGEGHSWVNPFTYGPERIQRRLRHNPEAEKASAEWLKAMPDRAKETYQTTLVAYEKTIQDIESKGKIPFIKEHLLSVMQQDIILSTLRDNDFSWPSDRNPSCIPEALLLSFTPVFLIRPPALMIGSNYRVASKLMKLQIEDEDFIMQISLRWTRLMMDYYRAQGRKPILVDAEDVLDHAEVLMPKLCGLLGIDAAGIVYSWDAIPKEQWPQDDAGIVETFIGTFMSSSGIMKRESRDPVNIEVETQKWAKLYDDDIASRLKGRVEAEMADYEYLRQFRLTA
ncbi:hypothetical protein LTR27_005759 [Elasticomyces elasticus]|nr:hypothetical protein LTR27_005759 [Elasticomyces elasticus]